MNYDEFKNKLMRIPYATGFSVYYNKKYGTYSVYLYRHMKRTIKVSLCSNFDECYKKIMECLRGEE